MDAVTLASESTSRLETCHVVDELTSRFGRSFVAYVTGSRDRSTPALWANENSASAEVAPTYEGVRRLRTVHAAAAAIELSDNLEVAGAWLISGNPRLGGHSPVAAIRNDQFSAVLSAAAAFLEGTYSA